MSTGCFSEKRQTATSGEIKSHDSFSLFGNKITITQMGEKHGTQQNRPIIAINRSRDARRQIAKRFSLTFLDVVQLVPQVEVLLRRRRRRRAARRRRTRAVRLGSHLRRRPEKATVSTCNTPIAPNCKSRRNKHTQSVSQKLNKAIKVVGVLKPKAAAAMGEPRARNSISRDSA